MSAAAETSSWPTHPDGTNKSIGEMTEEERRPLLRAAFLRSKIGEIAPQFKYAFEDDGQPSEQEEWRDFDC